MKSQVYSWRLSSGKKARLEKMARRRKIPLAKVIDAATDEWLARNEHDANDEKEQKRLHAIARRLAGTICSGNPNGSRQIKEAMGARLAEKYGR
jgi:hypothetical protein